MNRWQKIAWFNLIVISATLALTGIVVAVLAVKVGMPKAWGGLGMLGFFGLMGLSSVIFRKDKGKVGFDERDQLINYRAVLGAYSFFWLIFTAVCMIPFFILGPGGSISVRMLPFMLVGICISLQLVHSVAILVQYGRERKGAKL